MTGLILAAAGSGARFESTVPKQFLEFHGKPIYLFALETIGELCEEIAVVVPPDWLGQVRKEQSELKLHERVKVVKGGSSRQESVSLGLQALSPGVTRVLVHDAVRPFVTRSLVGRVLAGLEHEAACVPVLPIAETVKEVDDHRVFRTLKRSRLRLAQTPQAFDRKVLERALIRAARDGTVATDEATLVERTGAKVYTVDGEQENIKITWKQDMRRLEPRQMDFRVGIGFDFHRFGPDRPLLLGGVVIPHERGLEGHSDADVILHALSDAILGAAGLSDIGSHFSDNDPEYKDLSSIVLLERVYGMAQSQGLRVSNLDITLIAEEPRLSPHIVSIKAKLGRVLHLDPSRIGVKATTMEQSGPIGRSEGIAAQAVVLLGQGREGE